MAQHFISTFHNILGTSIHDQQKNLHTFLKNVSLTSKEKAFVLDNLRPKTHLEHLFYIDVLVHLRDTTRLLKIFKDGKGVFVCKIVKHPWFFQEALENVDPKTLVDTFLPSLSFSVKIKLLRNLALVYTEDQINQIFDYIEKRYGLFMATTFITDCSSDKILDILKTNKVKLLSPQLKRIYKKQPKLINVYLQEQMRYHGDNIFDNNFLTYLAQKNPDYFWELIEKHKIKNNIKIGRRTTKKLLPLKTQEIISDPKKYIKYLSYSTLLRKLNKEGHFKQLYYNLFPRDVQDLDNLRPNCVEILNYYPKNYQFNLFVNTFQEVMKQDIWNYTYCVKDSLLKIIPDPKIRESWAQIKYKESENVEYLKYYEVKKSIALIKDKINTTSNSLKRKNLIVLLVKSCALSKDLMALEEILKYFCIRHRNEDAITRSNFLAEIEKHFKKDEFSSSHWKYITEIFIIQTLNQEYVNQSSKLRLKHVEYLFDNNGSEEDENYFILEYLKQQIAGYESFNILNDTKNIEAVKSILLCAVQNLNSLLKSLNIEYRSYHVKIQLIEKIFWFNIKYPKEKINIEENEILVKYIMGVLGERPQHLPYTFTKLFSQTVICKANRSKLENEFVKRYFKRKPVQFFFDIAFMWCLKYDPLVITENFDSIMEALPQKMYNIWTKVKLYNDISPGEKVLKYCLNKLKHGQNKEKANLVQFLSILISPESYIKLMEDLNIIPTSSKIQVEDADSDIFKIQQTFLKNFKNCWHPEQYLPFLLDKFCQGDYLRPALAPLYFAFHKIPENKLEIHLENLANNKAMSVKKHSLFLAGYVCEQQKFLQITNRFETNKNESLQKCICLSSLRYFMKNPKPECFAKVISYMKFLKQHDVESLQLLASIYIPENYQIEYLINLWDLLEKLKLNDNAVGLNTLMSTVLKHIDKECIRNLPQDFSKDVINRYFSMSREEDVVAGIFQFAIRYLVYHPDQDENFKYIFEFLSKHKTQHWEGTGKTAVYNFFNAFYAVACNKEITLDFVKKFSKYWQNTFSYINTFKEYVFINLIQFKKEANDDLEIYTQHIVRFAEEINTKFGELVFSKFIVILSEFCSFKNKKERTELLRQILKYKTTQLSGIFVIELIKLHNDMSYKNKIEPKYQDINSILSQIEDPKVQLCYNLLLRN